MTSADDAQVPDSLSPAGATRRRLIGGVAAAIGAVFVKVWSKPARAEQPTGATQPGSPLLIDERNTAHATTSLVRMDDTDAPVIEIISNRGPAMSGVSQHGPVAVSGVVEPSNVTVTADVIAGVAGIGPLGVSGLGEFRSSDPLVRLSGIGVRGEGPGAGVVGALVNLRPPPIEPNPVTGTAAVIGAGSGLEVAPSSMNDRQVGIGLHGVVRMPADVAVRAEHVAGGLALEVVGGTSFSMTGTGVIERLSSEATVHDPRVGSHSKIVVNLTSDPGQNAVVQWVDVMPGQGFVLKLTNLVKNKTLFCYLILD